VDINKEFELFNDLEISEDEKLLEGHKNIGTLLNGTIPIC
jgi:hypothetical protein